MHTPTIPKDEAVRLSALHSTKLLDSPAEERFDRLTRIARQLFEVPIALVSLIDAERQWFKSRQGLNACETSRDVSFCGHAILGDSILEVPDATRDARFADNPLVTGPPDIRFYAGAPLRTRDGQRIGTLCIIDTRPRALDDAQRQSLRDLADCIEREINSANEALLQARLTRSLQRSNAIVASLPDIVFVVDRAGTLLAANEHPDLLYTRSELLGQRLGDLLPAALSGRCLDAIAEALSGDTLVRLEYTLELAGAPADFEARIRRLSDDDALVLIRNVTAERNARLDIERQLEAFHVLNEIAASEPLPLTEQITQALRLATDYLGLECGIVSRIRGDDYQVRAFVAPPDMPLEPRQHFALDHTYCALTLHSEDLLAIDRMATSPHRSHPCYGKFGLEAYIGIPLAVGGVPYGTLNFSARTPRRRPFRESEKMFLRLLARWTTSTIERERALQSLRLGEARLRGLFELSPIGIALNDFATGTFLEVNDALIAPTDYTRDEFLTLSYWDLTPIDYQEQEREQLNQLEQTGRYGPYEKEYIRKDGSRYPVLLNGILMHDPDGRRRIWSIIEDISERKRMERMKNEFISTISHELRTPVTAISGALGMLSHFAAQTLPESAREMLGIAEKNSQRLGLLINDLLDMEKLAAGKLRLDLATQPLRPVVEQAVRDNQAYADQFDVTLELLPGPEAIADIDANRLQQVLANLLSNAAKFSPHGARVEISLDPQTDRARICVTDHGPGIPAAFRDRIFEKFSQSDASDTRQRGGTGLGLAISRELVERMGGTIGFDSTEGLGASFRVSFPLQAQA